MYKFFDDVEVVYAIIYSLSYNGLINILPSITTQTDEIASDVFGTTTYDSLNNVHINDALLQMRQGLINMPQTETMAVLNAQRKRPEIVDDQNMLKFLLAEKFNISVSCELYVLLLFFIFICILISIM
jgi:hypothetical protein